MSTRRVITCDGVGCKVESAAPQGVFCPPRWARLMSDTEECIEAELHFCPSCQCDGVILWVSAERVAVKGYVTPAGVRVQTTEMESD